VNELVGNWNACGTVHFSGSSDRFLPEDVKMYQSYDAECDGLSSINLQCVLNNFKSNYSQDISLLGTTNTQRIEINIQGNVLRLYYVTSAEELIGNYDVNNNKIYWENSNRATNWTKPGNLFR